MPRLPRGSSGAIWGQEGAIFRWRSALGNSISSTAYQHAQTSREAEWNHPGPKLTSLKPKDLVGCPSVLGENIACAQVSTNPLEVQSPGLVAPNARERPLPISPLMNPAFLAAKAKYKSRKGLPTTGDPGSLHARLAKNPYALALATPIRKCRNTNALLPTFFLQDFNMMAHPETGEAWYMPISLAKSTSQHTNQVKPASLDQPPGATSRASDVEGTESADQKTKAKSKKIGYNIYTMSSRLAIDQMQSNMNTLMFIPQRYGRLTVARSIAAGAGWRQDMGTFIRDLWRRRISEDLAHVSNLGNGYMVNCDNWEFAKLTTQIGAILWIGSPEGGATPSPPQWATLDIPHGHKRYGETRKVPVYNLPALLGEETLASLKSPGLLGEGQNSAVLKGNIVVVKDKKATLKLRMKLWSFQGYMAVPDQRQVLDDAEEEEDDDEDDDEEDEDNLKLNVDEVDELLRVGKSTEEDKNRRAQPRNRA